MFLGLPDPDPYINKQKNKYLNFHYFVTFFKFLFLKNDVNVRVPSKVVSKKLLKKLIFVGLLSANDEKSMIRNRTKIFTDPQHCIFGRRCPATIFLFGRLEFCNRIFGQLGPVGTAPPS
jgi:hypothetical protein